MRNIFDPGFDDGKSELETDGVETGFGLSTLYQASEKTRWGLTYQSKIEPDNDGDSDFSGLGPNTERVFDRLGILNADIGVESTSPQSVLTGIYHEWDNGHALTTDIAWIDFSEFRLSEYYFNGNAFLESDTDYDDIYAISSSYTWPISKRWMLGVSGLLTNQMIDDDERTMTLRLDALWSVGFAAQWKWTDNRNLNLSLSYMGLDDAPVTTGEIPGLGSLDGEFTQRGQQHLGGASRHRGECVGFRYPEALVTQLLTPARHGQGFLQRGGCLSRAARQGLVEYRKFKRHDVLQVSPGHPYLEQQGIAPGEFTIQ